MKIKFEDIKSKQGQRSFMAYAYAIDYFRFNLHYHPEYELTLITQGSGERMIGDTLCHFEAGDLVLLGANLPHTWASQENSSAVVIQFSAEFIQAFLSFEEFKDIKILLEKAKNGLAFGRKATILNAIQALPAKENFYQAIGLLEILHQLTQISAQAISANTHFQLNKQAENRINKVCSFIQENYCKKIHLQEIADLIHLSESAFCKFFKKATHKTFSEYVNFIRIQAVCRALLETDKMIVEIAFANGFESLTYFNRIFKKEKGITPKAFRQSSF